MGLTDTGVATASIDAQLIPAETTVGSVHLTVRDLASELSFYQQALGMKLHRREGATAVLGAGGDDILVLRENPEARRVPRATGLYHFAVLVPSRLELARSLRRLSEAGTPLQGFADHFVSEAVYLADPEGNGIEIYRDRPRSDWYDSRGNFVMGTEPLDLQGVLAELEKEPAPSAALDPGTRLGHVHLQVAQVSPALDFYTRVLGFGAMAHWGSAGFVSAGGYHHHIAFNTWNSAGAPPPPPDAAGLEYFTVRLPDSAGLGKVLDRVREAGVSGEETEEGVLVRDPSHNGVLLTATRR